MSETGKTVLITGGAVRVGRAIALHLAALGWHVGIHYHRSDEDAEMIVRAIESCGVKAAALPADLSIPGETETLVSRSASALGPLTALVNNAAAFQKDRLHTLDAAQWQTHMNINLLAPLLLTKAFAAQLPEETDGAVVNLSDGCEGLCMSPKFLSYSLSKYGLEQATRLLAEDLAPRIRVNAVAPGMTLPKPGEEAMFDRLVARTPLQKPSPPEAIAEAVAFLLSASSVTGEVLRVNSGANLNGRD